MKEIYLQQLKMDSENKQKLMNSLIREEEGKVSSPYKPLKGMVM